MVAWKEVKGMAWDMARDTAASPSQPHSCRRAEGSQKGSSSCEAHQALCCARPSMSSLMSRQTRDLKSVHPTWTTWSTVYDWGHWEAQDWEGKARTRTRGTPFSAVTACLPLPTLEPFAGPSLQCPRLPCLPSHPLEMPTKGLCAPRLLCSPFWKKCFRGEI